MLLLAGFALLLSSSRTVNAQPGQPVPATPPSVRPAPPAGSWLDMHPIRNWNNLGTALPEAPPRASGDTSWCCWDAARQPVLLGDRFLVMAGWTLHAPAMLVGEVAVIQATSDFDEWCRPVNHQLFVFFRSSFAGTLSPYLMQPETDGEKLQLSANRDGSLWVEFARYREGDPPCCPSGKTAVTYEVELHALGPVAVPRTARTERW